MSMALPTTRGKPGPRLRAQVGEFKSASGALVPTGEGGVVGWRKYTVRPGFPKDSPSHLLWLVA